MKTITSPVTTRNLTAWFVSVPPAQDIPDYTVLEQAMESQTGFLHETGSVNELLIENTGDHDLYIQAGDIVKGGRQDRTIGADFIVPARSGKVPIPVFCVESARWHKREDESAAQFSKSSNYASSKRLRAAIQGSKIQGEVWAAVEEEQVKMSASLGLNAKAEMSPSSLQLSYENEGATAAIQDYIEGMQSAPSPDVAGVVWAINGKLSHADIYASSTLFRKVWKKLLQAAAFEAIGECAEPVSSSPLDIAEVSAWLDEHANSTAKDESLPPRTRLSTWKAGSQLRFETHDTAVAFPIHLSIIVH